MKECNGPYTKTTPELFQDYPFELSDFQKWAIYAITQNNDCLVLHQQEVEKHFQPSLQLNGHINIIKR